MKTIVITGSQGFIGSYLCQEFLGRGYKVIGIDNYSKYGYVVRPQDTHPNFKIIQYDLKDGFPDIPDVDYIIAGAARIGGISYFHKYAYDLLAENERIIANTFDFAIKKKIKRILVISSSMVFENCTTYPSKELDVRSSPPPESSYGFQKLAVEYFARAANEQHGLEYTIVRPFNCVGVGEDKALGQDSIKSGNIELMMSHVLPDLINKILKGQYPVHILGDGEQVRCYTNGKDIARGIRLALESDLAVNEDYNISTSRPTSVKELLNIVWNKLNPNKELQFISDTPYKYDVKFRLPDVEKANKHLGFKSEISLEESVDEVIEWMKNHES